MKDNLDKQAAFNETHKLKMNEDFEKWKKQKHWQQLAEKLKTKLKEKEDANEKLQDTCNGYRILIQRLEREKHSLEARLKTFRITNPHTIHAQVENLRSENIKLQAEVEVLNSKLEISQHHSGGLGAAMLQEKLEAQERKIAVLELSAKVSKSRFLFYKMFIGLKSNHKPPTGLSIMPLVSIFNGNIVFEFKANSKFKSSNDNAIFVWIIANL